MKTTSDIFKLTEAPVVVKDATKPQNVALKDMDAYLRKRGYTPITSKQREELEPFLQTSQVRQTAVSDRVAESGPGYPETNDS